MYNSQARQKHPQYFLEFFISAFQRIFTNYSLFQPWSDMALNTKQGDKDGLVIEGSRMVLDALLGVISLGSGVRAGQRPQRADIL